MEKSTGSESGFTLLEMIVSMTIFLLVTGMMWGILQVARGGRTTVNQEVELSKTLRVAMNLIGRDTYNAGYGYPLKSAVVLPDNRITALVGIPNDFDTTRDTVPPVLSGNNITLNTINTTPGTRTDQITFLFKDSTFNPIGAPGAAVSAPLSINAATTNGSGIDEIVPIDGSNSVCRIFDVYVINGNTGSTLGMATGLSGTNKIQFANGDPLNLNLTGSTGPLRGITVPASLHRVNMVTYFVAADGTLTRRKYGNNQTIPAVPFIDEPLVYNVEDFQIQYVMDDGSVSNNPSAGVDGVSGNADDEEAMLQAVRQVRFTISSRSTELAPNRQPFRATLTSTFSTRNLGYDAN
ncbi:MAG TPA: prepilin-type N-terminal cleavage/methylation domain-containing protein [Pyrinomonadaceae bacterium]|nr:prepilin-type N-terminal cleavage/methylation domain-containing protein [Pyrinomonadaceae bacterium]